MSLGELLSGPPSIVAAGAAVFASNAQATRHALDLLGAAR